jgi:hypothetical protein
MRSLIRILCLYSVLLISLALVSCGTGGGNASSGNNVVAPSITAQPSNQTVTAGQTATFSVGATGTPSPTYQWSKNNAAIAGATSASYTTPVTVAADNGSQFTVTMSNSAGSITSTAATLTVNVPPSVTTQPSNQTVTAGQTATFTVATTGTPAPTYQWLKNNVAISGATSASYTTPATVAADNGAQFTVTATNVAGNQTSNPATLNVNVPPSFTTQPSNQAVTVGQTATFTSSASGIPAPTYQWSKNNVAISGATSASYTTPATVIGDNGSQFTVTATNVAGNQTSNPATLTVNPVLNPAPGLTSISPTVVVPGHASFTLTVTGQNFISGSVVQVNGSARSTNVANGTQLTATITAADVVNSGQLAITIVNPAPGGGTSNAATLVVNATVSVAAVASLKITNAGANGFNLVKHLGNITGVSGLGSNAIAIASSDGVSVVFNPEVHFGQFASSQVGSPSLPGVKIVYPTVLSGIFYGVAPAGDLDGDGIGDFLIYVNVATSDQVGKPGAGTVFAIKGGLWLTQQTTIDLTNTSLSTVTRMEGSGLYNFAGQSMADGKDFDGDGFADIAFAAPGYNFNVALNNGSGAVYVIFGHSGFFNVRSIDLTQVGMAVRGRINTRRSLVSQAASLGSVFPGSSTIAFGGDLTGDGLPELLITDEGTSGLSPFNQKVYALSWDGVQGTVFVEDIGVTFKGATFIVNESGCSQTGQACYNNFGWSLSGRNGSIMIGASGSFIVGSTAAGTVFVSEAPLTNGQVIDARLAPQSSQATSLWDMSTSVEEMGWKVKDGSDFRLIGIPRFNQDQGRLVFVTGSHLPIGTNVDLASVVQFTILGEGNTQFSYGMDRSSDGAYIVVSSGGAAYLIPRANLLF